MRKNNRLSLKQKMYAALLAVIMVMAALIWTQAKQTDEPEQVAEETENFEPAPLVIENQSWESRGVYYGTIVISGSGVADESYEGLMLIMMDGEYIRVTCTDAVRSRFGDVF